MGMSFAQWLNEYDGYSGDGSTESIQSAYSAGEADVLWQKYDREVCPDEEE